MFFAIIWIFLHSVEKFTLTSWVAWVTNIWDLTITITGHGITIPVCNCRWFLQMLFYLFADIWIMQYDLTACDIMYVVHCTHCKTFVISKMHNTGVLAPRHTHSQSGVKSNMRRSNFYIRAIWPVGPIEKWQGGFQTPSSRCWLHLGRLTMVTMCNNVRMVCPSEKHNNV